MKTTTIYYFTSTGNSLAVARKLAKALGNAEIQSIAQALNEEKIPTDADMIGIITPVYAMGTPRIVTDFLKRLTIEAHQYVFAIATCNGMISSTFRQMNKVLKANGGRIHAGFAVKEPYHDYPEHDSDQVKFNRSLTRKKAEAMTSFDARQAEIMDTILQRRRRPFESSSVIFNIMGYFAHEKVVTGYCQEDRHFEVAQSCTGCGCCRAVCPRGNIDIKKDQPTWQHDCDLCFACYQWCPKKAISFKGYKASDCRGHNTEINLKDILAANDKCHGNASQE